jgi:hypothetical protein
MNELTPEERRRIYEEERMKMEPPPPLRLPAQDETLGYVLLIIPFVAALMMYFWVGSMRLIDNPASMLNLLGIGTILVTAIIAAIEASRLGFGSGVKKESSPLVIFFGMALLWLIVYPAYFVMRARKGQKNMLLGAILVTLIFCLAWYWIGSAVESALRNMRAIYG